MKPLTWDDHIKYIHSKASSRLYLFKRLRHHLDKTQAQTVYTTLVQSVMDYGDIVWSSCSAKSQNLLQKIQNKGLRSIHSIPMSSRSVSIIFQICFTRPDGLTWQLEDGLGSAY